MNKKDDPILSCHSVPCLIHAWLMDLAQKLSVPLSQLFMRVFTLKDLNLLCGGDQGGPDCSGGNELVRLINL